MTSTIYAGSIVSGSVRMTDTPGGAEMTQFASAISVVYLVFDYSDMHNEEFMVRVYYYSGEMLFEQSKVYTGSGTESVEISLAGGGAFPDGRYLTNLYSGLFPISTIIWEVGGAPKIKTFLPCIVKQWPPSVTPTPTRTPAVTTTPSPTPGYDLYEPNNSFSMAYPILSAERYFAYMNPGSDLDHFRFDAQSSSPIVARLTIPDPENMTYVLELYFYDGANYNRLDTKANLAGEETITITFDPPKTGRYYVKVYSVQNRFDPSKAYELMVVFDRALTPTPSPTSTPTVTQPTTGTPTSTPTPTPTSTPGAGEWVIECVDCPRQFSQMTDRSLRLDTAGHPHIAYGEDHLYYAWYDGAGWQYETVDDAPEVGMYASLALDGNGYPHISYSGYYYGLKYAYQDASGWHIETVDGGIDDARDTSLALDRDGYPHISYFYCDAGPPYGACQVGDLRYAYQNGSGWQIETVDSEGIVGGFTSLALDRDGYPHISYYGSYYGLKYAYQDATGWHLETVDSEGGGDTSLALDRDSYPHISYHGGWPNNALKYAYKDASGWHIETVDGEGRVGSSTSLALDGSGYPHISYHYCGTSYPCNVGDLKYAYQDASGWHIQTVDIEGDVGWFTSLALDRDGCSHISYFDWSHEDLKYACQDASGWHIETVDSEGEVGEGTSLALDRDGYPHISYYDNTNYDLKYAYQDASGWHIETVDSEGNVGWFTSLALDESRYPHISYYDDTNDDLKYAYRDASGWQIQTVDTGLGWNGGHSLALDGDGYPHISYYYCGTSIYACDVIDLKYAYQDASGWHIEIVDSEGGVGCDTSLALDESGYPHISYHGGYPNFDLRYAYQDASGWHMETVDSEEDVGRFSSLDLDEESYPHISYYYCGASWLCDVGDLKYAYQDASGWHIQTVDSEEEEYVGFFTSLALDGNGYPHISYHASYPNFDLKYAYQDASGWHIETVDSEANIGQYTSLALDAGGYPHISYYAGYPYHDLKYAYYSAPWLNWRDPGRPLLLPLHGATMDIVYRNIAAPATLTATLSGPAIFTDGSQVLTANVTEANGTCALHLKPAAGAMYGETFTLEVILADLRLERVGAIAWEVYLPLIRKGAP